MSILTSRSLSLRLHCPFIAGSGWALHTLTFSPEAQAPLGHGDLPVLVGVAGVEEGSDADLVLVQVDGRQLGLAQIQIAVGVQL